MRVFLDTNILLDLLLNRQSFVADSESVVLRCEALGAEMFIAWHGLATAYYLIKRGRTEAEALVEVDKILAWARVAEGTDAHARQARSLGFGDFEDALQAVAASACAADWIVTRKRSGLRALRCAGVRYRISTNYFSGNPNCGVTKMAESENQSIKR